MKFYISNYFKNLIVAIDNFKISLYNIIIDKN